MEHHPDRNNGSSSSEEKFKQIVEAYSVLSDPNKKGFYTAPSTTTTQNQRTSHETFTNVRSGFGKKRQEDTSSRFNQKFDTMFQETMRRESSSMMSSLVQYNPENRNLKGQNLRVKIDVTLEDLAFGVEKRFRMEKFNKCKKCNGVGMDENKYYSDCEVCKGTGRVKQENILSVRIPSKFGEDSLMFEGRGEAGINNNASGDLIVELNLIKHNKFEKIEDNIFSEKKISFNQALMGAEIIVETLYGNREIYVPSGVMQGEIFVIKNAGLGNKGDHFVEVRFDPEKNEKKSNAKNDSLIDILQKRVTPKFKERLIKKR